jgi:HEAT repeat protein
VQKEISKKLKQLGLSKATKRQLDILEQLSPKDPTSISVIREIMVSDQSLGIKLRAIKKLEECANQEAVQCLLAAIKKKATTSDERMIRTNAIAALARMRINEARLALKELLLDLDQPLCLKVIQIIGAFGDKAMIPLLEGIARIRSQTPVQQELKKAILKIKSRD